MKRASFSQLIALVLALVVGRGIPALGSDKTQAIYPPPGYTLQSDHESPLHTFHIEVYSSDKDDDRPAIVWLVSHKGEKVRAVRLYDPAGSSPFDSPGSIDVSPDEHWILREQAPCRGENVAYLYERSSSLHYPEVGPLPFSEQAWEFFRKQTGNSFTLDYRFGIKTGQWPTNSHALLVSLLGEDARIVVSEWLCYYDLQKHRFYLDETLKQRNKQAVSPVAEK